MARSCMAVFNSRPFTQPADLTGIKLQILRGGKKGRKKIKGTLFLRTKKIITPQEHEAISARKKHQMPTIYFKHTKALGIKK